MFEYEKKFNASDSKVKMDQSWEWYRFEKKNIIPINRYKYSISRLYGNVLDVGSGDGYGAYLMSKNPKIKTITCVEIQDKAIQEAKKNLKGIKNITIVKGIGEDMLFKKKFDSIHCGATLEHVFNDRAVLKEIKRLLKGIAIISVPILSPIDPLGHIRQYKSVKKFLNLLKKYFEIITYKIYPKYKHKNRSTIVVIVK